MPEALLNPCWQITPCQGLGRASPEVDGFDALFGKAARRMDDNQVTFSHVSPGKKDDRLVKLVTRSEIEANLPQYRPVTF